MAGPFISERSIVAWERETTRGTAPSTASAWRELGRVTSIRDLGPRWSVFKDAVIGASPEPHEVGTEGKAYGPVTLDAFQVRDPLFLGYAWSVEESVSSDLGGGFFRHTLKPDAGLLDSFSLGIRDRAGDDTEESIIFLECIMPRISIRGEQVNPDGSGGRVMAAPDIAAHDHQTAVVGNADPEAVTVTLQSLDPYRWYHGRLQIDGTTVGRVESWEFTLDRRAQFNFYWRDDSGKGPFEAPIQAAEAGLTMTVVPDKSTYTTNTETLRELVHNERLFDVNIRAARTVDQDEWDLDLTDVVLEESPRSRSSGKVKMEVRAGAVRQSRFRYVNAVSGAGHFA